jgi:hypothetical protein
VEVFSFFDDDLTSGNDPLLFGTPAGANLKKRGDFFVAGGTTTFTYDIATNTAQGFIDPQLPVGGNKQPDRKLIFVVRMRDINDNLSSPAVLTLENEPPPVPTTAIVVPVGARQLAAAWNVETDDPDFRGVVIWAVEGDQPDFEAIGSNVGEGNVVFKGNESPAKWAADPDKVYTIKIAAYDAFPVVADKLNKLEL